MRRSTRFFVGLAAAILTYAGLTAAVGSRHFRYRDGYPYRAYGYEQRHYPCNDARRDNLRPAPQPGQTPGQPNREQF
jgi:hypothetical protein